MKNLVLLFVMFLSLGVVNAIPEVVVDPPVSWKSKTHDFGKIEKGIPVDVEFTFVNESDQPILIKNVRTSCGCTASKYSETPILPGEESKITATYNAAKSGKFSKDITVYFQGEQEPIVLSVSGEVAE